jgi:hypothetical protein
MVIASSDLFGFLNNAQVASDMKKIEMQVATDFLEQYKIAKRSGNAMDTCIQAGLVKASLLQLHDEKRYKEWTKVEEIECAKAGL